MVFVAIYCRVRTDGSATENLLSQRVRFEARLITTYAAVCILLSVIVL